MKRSGILLATLLATVFGSALVASGPASAAEVTCLYNGGLHPCVWYPGYAYEYGYPYGTTLATAPLTPAETAPLMTGRSVAVSGAASSPCRAAWRAPEIIARLP